MKYNHTNTKILKTKIDNPMTSLFLSNALALHIPVLLHPSQRLLARPRHDGVARLVLVQRKVPPHCLQVLENLSAPAAASHVRAAAGGLEEDGRVLGPGLPRHPRCWLVMGVCAIERETPWFLGGPAADLVGHSVVAGILVVVTRLALPLLRLWPTRC